MQICYKVYIVDKLITIDCVITPRISYGSTYLKLGQKSFLSFAVANHQPCQVNEKWSSLQVATQASENSINA